MTKKQLRLKASQGDRSMHTACAATTYTDDKGIRMTRLRDEPGPAADALNRNGA